MNQNELISNAFIFSLLWGSINAQSSMGKWEESGSGGNVCIHSALLPNSKLLCFERPHQDPYPINPFTNGRTSSEIDLMGRINSDGSWTASWTQTPLRYNAFCAGHSLLPNGSVLVIGGDNQSWADPNGVPFLVDGRKGRRIYDPCNSSSCTVGKWTDLEPMAIERWYPTTLTNKNGVAMSFGGTTTNLDFDRLGDNHNPTYEYWPNKPGVWPRKLDILEWAYPHSLYPMAFQLPSGNVFLFVSNKTILINPDTDVISFAVPDMPVMDHDPWIYPHTPTMVMLPLTKANNYTAVLQVCGGSKLSTTEASPMCWRINPDAARPQWTQVDDMPHARTMPDAVLLPDGKILYVNGAGRGKAGGNAGQVQYATNPVYATDLYDPDAPTGRQWTTLASASVARLYHSGAILLESGHVITVGSEMKNFVDIAPVNRTNCWPWVEKAACTDAFEYRIERFTPPYLLTGAQRPIITTAPEKLTHNSSFIITMSQDASIYDRVTFIRYTAVTHSTNTDQRFVELEILAKDGKNLVVRMPRNSAIAPPGNWHLFVLSNGVPSVAKMVNLNIGPATSVPYTSKGNNNQSSAGFSMRWTTWWASTFIAVFVYALIL